MDVNFGDYVQLFFQYGPFAILPFLMLYALPRLYKKMKTASKDLKPILKRNIWMYQVLTITLVVFCVGYWVSYLSGPKFYYGDVVDFPTATYALRSPDLHLRTVTTAGESTIQWIWRQTEGQLEAKICFIRGNASTPEKSFYLYDDDLKKGKCQLVYNKEEGYLYYRGKPLPTTRKTYALNEDRSIESGFFTLFAQERINIDGIIARLQAIDFNIRGQTVERVIMLSGDDRETVDAVLRGGFATLKSIRSRPDSPYWRYNPELLISSLLSIGNALNRPPWTEFEHWLGLVGEQGLDLVVEAAGHPDPQIQTLAIDFLLRFKDPIIEQIEPKMQSEEYRQNENYIRGALNVTSRLPEKRELLLHLQEQPWIQSHRGYKDTVEVNIRQMEIERPEGLNPNLGRVIDMAWALKEKNIRYRWGGRSEDEGFDSAGFIAYILNRSEIPQAQRLKDPELWRTGVLREAVGERRPENLPREVGDLVFYMDGFVMFYLGENRIIGMTERGIIVNNYLEFHGNPIQVNKVVYE